MEGLGASAAAAGGASPALGPLARLSAHELVAGYRDGRFTPSDVIEDVIAALQWTHARCNVVATDMYAEARRDAEAATAAWRVGEATGALAGVPVTVKDLIFVADVPCKGGAPMLESFVPTVDAAVVSSLRAAGAILTCKTTTSESGYKLSADSPLTGITRNPWRLDRTSGGSSGGAATAVAAGCGPLALATDGVGSIRVPSAFCGVYGLKPTFGLVPRAPGFFPPAWPSLAHTGPIARTVRDAALLLEVIAGHDVRDPASLSLAGRRLAHNGVAQMLAGLRIGFSADLGYAPVDREVKAAFQSALDALADLGADLMEIDPGVESHALDTILKPIGFTEQAAAMAGYDETSFRRSDPEFRAVVAKGCRYSGTDYMGATHRRMQLRARFVALFQNVDALVTPTVAVTAFAAGNIGVDEVDDRPVDPHLGWSPFSWPINLCGLPAATIPCGYDAAGLPIGLQIVAPWLDEPKIIQISAAFEAARPWAGLWPRFETR